MQSVIHYSGGLYRWKYTTFTQSIYAGGNEARRPYGSATRAAASKGGRDRQIPQEYVHFAPFSRSTCILNGDTVPVIDDAVAGIKAEIPENRRAGFIAPRIVEVLHVRARASIIIVGKGVMKIFYHLE